MPDDKFIAKIASYYVKLMVLGDEEDAIDYLTRLEKADPGIADEVADYLEACPIIDID